MPEAVWRYFRVRLRFSQTISVLGDLFALPGLRQSGEVIQMSGSDRIGGLDDEVHVICSVEVKILSGTASVNGNYLSFRTDFPDRKTAWMDCGGKLL
jgi:hypothetical protein